MDAAESRDTLEIIPNFRRKHGASSPIKDKKKLVKAGFATPRGGRKGAYQNHVVRSNQVIIPFERLPDVDLSLYRDGYVIRLWPEQYFDGPKQPRPEFLREDNRVKVGTNAFLLYRSHNSFENYPPPDHWQVRHLVKDSVAVTERGGGATDVGEDVTPVAYPRPKASARRRIATRIVCDRILRRKYELPLQMCPRVAHDSD